MKKVIFEGDILKGLEDDFTRKVREALDFPAQAVVSEIPRRMRNATSYRVFFDNGESEFVFDNELTKDPQQVANLINDMVREKKKLKPWKEKDATWNEYKGEWKVAPFRFRLAYWLRNATTRLARYIAEVGSKVAGLLEKWN